MTEALRKAADVDPGQTVASWRAVLIGLFLLVPNAFWIVYMETVFYIAHSTNFGLLFHAVFNLTLLVTLNAALRRMAPGWSLGKGSS